MPRLPAIRVSYQNDANYLLRLVDAIERDVKRPLAWRKKMIVLVKALALEFINAPEAGVVELESESKRRKTTRARRTARAASV